MRLAQQDVAIIKAAAAEFFGARATVRLFGSRVHDDARGGDVDLLVELPEGPADEDGADGGCEMTAARMAVRLERAFHGRRVDVLVLTADQPREPIHQVALAEGVLL